MAIFAYAVPDLREVALLLGMVELAGVPVLEGGGHKLRGAAAPLTRDQEQRGADKDDEAAEDSDGDTELRGTAVDGEAPGMAAHVGPENRLLVRMLRGGL